MTKILFRLKYIFIVFIIFQACKQKTNKDYESLIPEKTLKFTDESYSIDSVGNFITNLKAIALETNNACIIGEIEKIQISHNYIYILDGITDCLLVFNTNGQFIFKINSIGYGPGEYLHLRDFYFDEETKELVLLGAHDKIIIYSKEGKFVSEKKLNFYPLKFQKTSNGFVFWNGNNSSGHPAITCTDKNYDIRKEYFPFDTKLSTSSNMLSYYDNNIYLKPFQNRYWNRIFSINSENLKLRYLMDFGENNWPEDQYENMWDSPYRKQGYSCFVGDFFEINNWITFKFSRNNSIHNAIYNKENNKSYWWQSNIKYNLPATIFQFIVSKGDNRFYSAVEISFVKNQIANYKEAYYKLGWPENSIDFMEFEKMINKSKVEDNPIVFSFSFR